LQYCHQHQESKDELGFYPPNSRDSLRVGRGHSGYLVQRIMDLLKRRPRATLPRRTTGEEIGCGRWRWRRRAARAYRDGQLATSCCCVVVQMMREEDEKATAQSA